MYFRAALIKFGSIVTIVFQLQRFSRWIQHSVQPNHFTNLVVNLCSPLFVFKSSLVNAYLIIFNKKYFKISLPDLSISLFKKLIMKFKILFTDSGLGAGTISSRWTPVGAGTTGTLVSADNGSNDVKHLDVGDMSDVSDVRKIVPTTKNHLSGIYLFISYYFFLVFDFTIFPLRMKRI